MTIQLPDNLEQSVQALVSGGRFASVDEAMAEAARLLIRQVPSVPKPLSKEAFHRRLLEEGVISRLPDPSQDTDDDDEPVTIAGEPLSETVIRERR